jgi:RNA polymerase sigma-70 factor (ECF subfamily)
MTQSDTFMPCMSEPRSEEKPADPAPDCVVLDQYHREQAPLRRYLVFLGIDADTAEEIVQETFLRLHGHIRAGGNRANLRAWLYRVAHNLARNEQTSARNRLCGPMNDEALLSGASIENGRSPEWLFLNRERDEKLRFAIGALSAPQRECLVLRAQGMKYREIAAVLDLSISAVAENVQRGLEKLKGLL